MTLSFLTTGDPTSLSVSSGNKRAAISIRSPQRREWHLVECPHCSACCQSVSRSDTLRTLQASNEESEPWNSPREESFMELVVHIVSSLSQRKPHVPNLQFFAIPWKTVERFQLWNELVPKTVITRNHTIYLNTVHLSGCMVKQNHHLGCFCCRLLFYLHLPLLWIHRLQTSSSRFRTLESPPLRLFEIVFWYWTPLIGRATSRSYNPILSEARIYSAFQVLGWWSFPPQPLRRYCKADSVNNRDHVHS